MTPATIRKLRPVLITEIMEMARLYEQEFKSISDICEIMSRPPATVHRGLRQAGVKMRAQGRNLKQHPNALSHKDVEQAVELYAQGKTVNEVALELGLTWGQARHRLLQNGALRSRSEALLASPNVGRLSEDLADEVVERYLAGGTCKGIGRQLSISPSSVSQVLARRGIKARPRRGGAAKRPVVPVVLKIEKNRFARTVPAAPLAAMLRAAVTRSGQRVGEEGETADEICACAGISTRALYRWEHREVRRAGFELADRVVTRMDKLWFDVFDPQAYGPGVFADRQRDDVLAWMDAVDDAAEAWSGQRVFGAETSQAKVAA